MAEWLGKALQKLLQQFESARDLKRDYQLDNPFFYSYLSLLLLLHFQVIITVFFYFLFSSYLALLHLNRLFDRVFDRVKLYLSLHFLILMLLSEI